MAEKLSLLEEQRLAEIVHLYPCLYDKATKGYKNREVILNAWTAVARKLDFIENAERAQISFFTLKKRYLKKRRDVKVSKMSGTSAEAVARAEKNFRPYKFMSWVDEFTQIREGKLRLLGINESGLDNDDSFQELNVTEPSGECREDDETEKEEVLGTSIKGLKEKSNKRSAEEALSDEMECSHMTSRRHSIRERKIYKMQEDAQNVPLKEKEESAEDLFCRGLALDLKALPPYEKLCAQQEIRNVMFKYQMAMFQDNVTLTVERVGTSTDVNKST